MTSDLEIIKEKAKYAATVEKEFEKSVKLLPNENIEFKNRGVVFTGSSISQSPGLIVLTNKRMIFLMHHFFGADKLLYIPISAVSRMNFIKFGFLRGAQTAIHLEYDKNSIVFAINYVQKFMTGFGGPKETIDFFEFLKRKLPEGIVNDTVILTKYWDYYLLLAGLAIGYLIGGVLPIFFCGGLGFLLGKTINKLIK